MISVRTEQRVIAVCYGTLGVCVVGIALVWGGDDRYALTSLGLVWAGVTAFMAPSVVKMVRSARRSDAIERFPEALAGLLSTREIIVLLLKRVVIWAVAALAAGFVVIGADVGGPLGGLFLGTSTLSLIAALAIKRLEVTRQALLFATPRVRGASRAGASWPCLALAGSARLIERWPAARVATLRA